MNHRSHNRSRNRFKRDSRRLRITFLLSCLVFFATLVAIQVRADEPIPTGFVSDFYGRSVTFNGHPAPIGSLVEAFDPQGVLCGKFAVETAGEYGFMHVYGDNGRTISIDEGAVPGDSISFFVNGRPALPLGPDDIAWISNSISPKQVDLSTSGTLGFESFELPTDKFAAPLDTVQFRIGFRNLGDVTDFYRLEVTSNLGWDLIFPVDFVYVPAGSGDQFVTFSVIVPFLDIELSDQLSFSLTSGLDAANGVAGNVNVFLATTDVDDDDGAVLPATFELGQNYPNPFNPTTKIPFNLQVRAKVTLKVYNVLGQIVDELKLGTLSAGAHEIDYQPTIQSSGVYFYKMSAGDFSATRRMILLK